MINSIVIRLFCYLSVYFVISPIANAQTVRYIHTDGLGSVSVVTDANRNVIERREYEPYGASIGGGIDGIGYTGHVMDAITGLTYMQQRYYDPMTGAMLSVDPVTAYSNGNVRQFNRYAYAFNNPYRFTDPDGRISVATGISGQATAVGGVTGSTQWVYSFPSLNPVTWSVGVLAQAGGNTGTDIGASVAAAFTWNTSANSAEDMAGNGPSASAGGSANFRGAAFGYDHDLGGSNQTISIGAKLTFLPAEAHTSVTGAYGKTLLTGGDVVNAGVSLVTDAVSGIFNNGSMPNVEIGPFEFLPPPLDPSVKKEF